MREWGTPDTKSHERTTAGHWLEQVQYWAKQDRPTRIEKEQARKEQASQRTDRSGQLMRNRTGLHCEQLLSPLSISSCLGLAAATTPLPLSSPSVARRKDPTLRVGRTSRLAWTLERERESPARQSDWTAARDWHAPVSTVRSIRCGRPRKMRSDGRSIPRLR